jgi:hypothetical protein
MTEESTHPHRVKVVTYLPRKWGILTVLSYCLLLSWLIGCLYLFYAPQLVYFPGGDELCRTQKFVSQAPLCTPEQIKNVIGRKLLIQGKIVGSKPEQHDSSHLMAWVRWYGGRGLRTKEVSRNLPILIVDIGGQNVTLENYELFRPLRILLEKSPYWKTGIQLGDVITAIGFQYERGDRIIAKRVYGAERRVVQSTLEEEVASGKYPFLILSLLPLLLAVLLTLLLQRLGGWKRECVIYAANPNRELYQKPREQY